jgi:hypothetical protein
MIIIILHPWPGIGSALDSYALHFISVTCFAAIGFTNRLSMSGLA